MLFYTWTPNWTVNQLKPGTDVVWIEAAVADQTVTVKRTWPFLALRVASMTRVSWGSAVPT